MTPHPGIAIITGASSGIGAAFARRLARDGYDLLLHGRREALLTRLRDELAAAYGTTSRIILAELSDPAGLRQLEDIIPATPALSMLVNNAGYSTLHFFEHEDRNGQQRLVDVHVVAPLRLRSARYRAGS